MAVALATGASSLRMLAASLANAPSDAPSLGPGAWPSFPHIGPGSMRSPSSLLLFCSLEDAEAQPFGAPPPSGAWPTRYKWLPLAQFAGAPLLLHSPFVPALDRYSAVRSALCTRSGTLGFLETPFWSVKGQAQPFQKHETHIPLAGGIIRFPPLTFAKNAHPALKSKLSLPLESSPPCLVGLTPE